jgi:hypothetical protein
MLGSLDDGLFYWQRKKDSEIQKVTERKEEREDRKYVYLTDSFCHLDKHCMAGYHLPYTVGS